MKKLCCTLVGALLVGTLTLNVAGQAVKAMQSTANMSSAATGTIAHWAVTHWANNNLVWAKSEGLLSKIGAEDRDAEASVSKAEFVKMTLLAMRIPESEREEITPEGISSDLILHSLSEEGYTEKALKYGIIQSGDYTEGLYKPDDKITRYEAAVIVSRMAGLVHPASKNDGAGLKFKDAVEANQKGVTAELTERNILLGYDDGTVRADRSLTLAEACTLLKRAVDYTEQGIDESITVTMYSDNNVDYYDDSVHVYIDKSSDVIPVETTLPVQVVDGVIYIPFTDYYKAIHNYSGLYSWKWNAADQKMEVICSSAKKIFHSGDDVVVSSLIYGSSSYESILFKECRMMRGEFMMPVYDIKNDSGEHSVYIGFANDTTLVAEYDQNTKRLELCIGYDFGYC